MGKLQDFENYDYDRFFAKLEEKLGYIYDVSYDDTAYIMEVVSKDTCITVGIMMHDRVQLDCRMGDVADAMAYCRKHTGHEGHLVFSEKDGVVFIHVQISLHLGQGWDDAIADFAASAVNEIAAYSEKTKAA